MRRRRAAFLPAESLAPLVMPSVVMPPALVAGFVPAGGHPATTMEEPAIPSTPTSGPAGPGSS